MIEVEQVLLQDDPYLALDIDEVGLDGLSLTDEDGVLLLVLGDALLQALDELLHLLVLQAVLRSLLLERVELVPQRLNAVQHVRVVDLP